MSSSNYLSSLLQSINDAHPNMIEAHVLSNIFPSLFLALVARNTNIILTTPHVSDLQKATAKILSNVFGLQTKRVKIRGPQSPHDLLVSLFHSSSPDSPAASTHKRKPSRSSIPRSHSAPRPPSSHFTEGSDSTAPPPAPSRLPRHKTDPLPPSRKSDSHGSLHLPQVVVISGLERAGGAAHLALAEVLRTRRVVLEAHDQDGVVYTLPDDFFVVYVSPVGDGCERPAIHTTLLDYFAFSITIAQAPTPASTSSPSPRLRPLPLASPSRKPPLLPYDRITRPEVPAVSPLVSHYTTALLTAARHHPELDGTLLTARCVKDAENLVRASGIVFRKGDELTTISEAHVRRVVPPVLAHRLRVRDSPREQIMGILWHGAGVRRWGDAAKEKQEPRRTVKVILGEILAEV